MGKPFGEDFKTGWTMLDTRKRYQRVSEKMDAAEEGNMCFECGSFLVHMPSAHGKPVYMSGQMNGVRTMSSVLADGPQLYPQHN